MEEALLADIVSEGINDFFQKYGVVRYSQPESERPGKIGLWKSEGTMAKYLVRALILLVPLRRLCAPLPPLRRRTGGRAAYAWPPAPAAFRGEAASG